MSDRITFPPPPDPVKMAQIAAVAKNVLSMLVGAGVLGAVWAGVSVEQITNWLTAALTLAGLVGGAYSMFRSWRRPIEQRAVLVASTVASVEQGQPVSVTVTPGNLPNEAVKISPAEIAKAPAAPPLNVAPSPAPKAA